MGTVVGSAEGAAAAGAAQVVGPIQAARFGWPTQGQGQGRGQIRGEPSFQTRVKQEPGMKPGGGGGGGEGGEGSPSSYDASIFSRANISAAEFGAAYFGHAGNSVGGVSRASGIGGVSGTGNGGGHDYDYEDDVDDVDDVEDGDGVLMNIEEECIDPLDPYLIHAVIDGGDDQFDALDSLAAADDFFGDFTYTAAGAGSGAGGAEAGGAGGAAVCCWSCGCLLDVPSKLMSYWLIVNN